MFSPRTTNVCKPPPPECRAGPTPVGCGRRNRPHNRAHGSCVDFPTIFKMPRPPWASIWRPSVSCQAAPLTCRPFDAADPASAAASCSATNAERVGWHLFWYSLLTWQHSRVHVGGCSVPFSRSYHRVQSSRYFLLLCLQKKVLSLTYCPKCQSSLCHPLAPARSCNREVILSAASCSRQSGRGWGLLCQRSRAGIPGVPIGEETVTETVNCQLNGKTAAAA